MFDDKQKKKGFASFPAKLNERDETLLTIHISPYSFSDFNYHVTIFLVPTKFPRGISAKTVRLKSQAKVIVKLFHAGTCWGRYNWREQQLLNLL